MKVHIQTTQMLRWHKTDLPKPGDVIVYKFGSHNALFFVLYCKIKQHLITCLNKEGFVKTYLYEIIKR